MIYIATLKTNTDNTPTITISDIEISNEEYTEYCENFKFYKLFHQLKELNDICVESYFDLYKFLSKKNLNHLLREDKMDEKLVIRTANKLILQYCTTIKLLVEKIESYLKHNCSDNKENFEKFISNFYDTRLSYRFFIRLRNYIIHEQMPFTKISASICEDCRVYMNKSELLKGNNWSTVKEDLLQMNDDIDIINMLEDIGGIMYAIYLQGLYYLAPEIIESAEKIGSFLKKYDLNSFEFVEYNSIHEFKNGNFVLHPSNLHCLKEAIDELNHHPSIEINLC